ncbi:MAG: nitroreductase family protein [Spirochaetaceae bacterium]|jgi:nitroreductase|nr:nitroreductase family protein [Spirochaetaceae bacterium]
MNIIDAIVNRRSIRTFLEKDIDRAILEKILTAGMSAPSAKNRQPWKFIVIANERKHDMISIIKSGLEHEKSGAGLLPNFKQYISSAEHTVKIMEEAPVTLFVINTENVFLLNQTAEEKLFEMANIQSIGASIQNILLAALEYGIGSLWICDIYFAYHELRTWLNTEQQIIAAVSLGYPNETPFPRARKRIDAIVEWK